LVLIGIRFELGPPVNPEKAFPPIPEPENALGP